MKPRVNLTKRFIITDAIQSVPFVEIVKQFLRDEVVNCHTRRSYQYALFNFLVWLAVHTKQQAKLVQLSDVTRSAVDTYAKELSKTYSIRTINVKLSALKGLLAYCTERHGTRTISDSIKLKNNPGYDFKGLTEEQAKKLRDYANAHLNERDGFIVKLLLFSGLRNEELRLLTIGNINPDKTWINGVIGKGSKLRDVPISPDLRNALIKYLWWREQFRCRKTDPLVISLTGVDRINPKTVWRIVHRACRKVGIPAQLAHPHALRHTYAYQLLDQANSFTSNGARSLIMVRDVLGHSSISTTEIYLANQKHELLNLVNHQKGET